MKHELSIQGMGCDHCIVTVRQALERVDGTTVEDVQIGTARIDIDPSAASVADAETAVREAGYEVRAASEVD